MYLSHMFAWCTLNVYNKQKNKDKRIPCVTYYFL